MKRIFPIAALLLTSLAASAQSWSNISALPSGVVSNGGVMYQNGTNLYLASQSGTSPSLVISIWSSTESSMPGGAWSSLGTISSGTKGLSQNDKMGFSPSGRPFIALNGGGVGAAVYSYNGVSWALISGYATNDANQNIYNFYNTASGNTCFGSSFNGDIWCNTAVNGTTFNKVAANVYSLTSLGSGGLYGTYEYTTSAGLNTWAQGEGQLLQLNSSYGLVAQFANGGGYTGNAFGLGKSAANILTARTANGSGDALTQINTTTLAQTIVPTSTFSGFPAFMNTNYIGGLQWMNGTNWFWNFQNSGGTTTYLKISANDGTAWSDIASTIPGTCTTISPGGMATPTYIYARCNGGKDYERYGPIGSASTVAITTQSPAVFGWNIMPLATRRIHATVTNGTTNQVTWAITSDTTGGASISASTAPNLAGAWADVTAGPTGAACTITGGTSATPIFGSTAAITVTATSVDDATKSTTFPINVCSQTVSVYISPFNIRAYQAQKVNLQSWVMGAVDDSVTWSITSQPGGGDGAFIAPPAGGSASTSRDALFSATVAGDYTLTATSVADGTKSATAIVSVSSNALPSYAVTPNHTEPVDCSVQAGNTGYDVGAGKTYASLAALFTANPGGNFSIGGSGYPVESAGVTIRLFNTDLTGSAPTRYHEYLRLDGQGTQSQPIRVVGCPDSAGNLPILDAASATAYSSVDNSAAASILGLYQIGMHHSGAAGSYPTILSPSYIIIEGLAFKNAYPTIQSGGSGNSNYFAPGSGSPTQWGLSASCIRPYEGNHLTVRGNDMEDCSFGILADFNASSNGWGGFFGDFDLEGNYFTNIGAANASEHMAYVQGFREVVQGNYFDQLKSVSTAGDLKLRGLGDIVRYNWFNQSYNTRTVDFVEEQDSNAYMSFLGYYYSPTGGSSSFRNSVVPGDTYGPNNLVAGDELWHKTYAYGNVVNMGPGVPPSQAPFHFFGDQGPYSDQNTNPPVRVGDFYVYSNSVYFAGGGVSSPPNFNFIDTQQNRDNQIRWEWPFLTIANNALFVPAGAFNLGANQAFQWSTLRSDIYNFGKNWISSNWGNNTQSCTNSGCWAGTGWPYYNETTGYMDGTNLPAHINNFSNVIVGGTTAPFSTTTFIPTLSGGLAGTGATLPATVTKMPVRSQMLTYTLTPRATPLTIGGVDYTGAATPVSIALTPSPVTLLTSGTQTMVCTTTLSDSSTRNCITPTLGSSNTGSATVSGLVVTATTTPGSGNITATAETLSAPNVPFTVTAPSATATKSIGVSSTIGTSKIF